jgi:DNA-binding response OmpR family regulator
MKPRILVVDDIEDLRELLAVALSPIAEVSQAADGRGALLKMKSEKPALVLLDISLPDMSGLDVLAAARKLNPELIVVMLTGDADTTVAKKALSLGASAFVTKPFSMDDVLRKLQRLLKPSPRPATKRAS